MNAPAPLDRSLFNLLLLTVVAAALPHLPRMPWWLGLLVVLLLIGRWQIQRATLPFPGRAVRLLMVTGSVAVVVASFGIGGTSVDIFVAILLFGVVLKLFEIRHHEESRALAGLVLLVLGSLFIYSQSIPLAVYSLAVVALVLASLNAAICHDDPPDVPHFVRTGAMTLALTLPLMLLLFLLVPRIGPLWAMPAPAGTATSGVSDELSPGDMGRLGLSEELAFRAGFAGAVPPAGQRYWRGLALDRFDGRSWRRSRSSVMALPPDQSRLQVDEDVEPFDYDLVMEPSGRRWVYALSPVQPEAGQLRQDRNYALYAERPLSQRERFRFRSWPSGSLLPLVPDRQDTLRSLWLPPGGEPQSRALAESLRQQSDSPAELVDAALAWFSEQAFIYTLEPGAYTTDDAIDQFLFVRREGYCEHYASAFAFLMRAAGLPARVVVGYQGGESNPYENYLMIYQYNAHAWVEVWIDGQGWIRVDPTTTVAPERIEQGAEAWLTDYQQRSGNDAFGLRSIAWLNALRLRLDSVDYAWNRWVINFDSESQFRLLEQLTGSRSQPLLAALMAGAMVILLVLMLVAVLIGGRRGPMRDDPLLRSYRRLIATAERRGIRCSLADGPWAVASTLSASMPRQAPRIAWLTEELIELVYRPGARSAGEVAYGKRLAVFRKQAMALRIRLRLSRRRTCS